MLSKAEKKKLKKAWQDSSKRVMAKIKARMELLAKDEKLKSKMEKEIKQCLTATTKKDIGKREKL